MNNERYNQILSELYYKFLEWQFDNQISIDPPWDEDSFIKVCKTDYEFLEFWGNHLGLKIEERELSEKERIVLSGYDYENGGGIGWNMLKDKVDMDNYIPRKLHTVTYNNETIEVYE